MLMEGDFGANMAMYTGSTTGTSRDNDICSTQFTPISHGKLTEAKCHHIPASSFDDMCAILKVQADNMQDELHAHSSHKLVADEHAVNIQANRKNHLNAKVTDSDTITLPNFVSTQDTTMQHMIKLSTWQT